MSVLPPKVKPSYQSLTCSYLSDRSNSDNTEDTSSCINPKQSVYLFEVEVTTARLFRSENMDSLLTRVIPVIMARSRYASARFKGSPIIFSCSFFKISFLCLHYTHRPAITQSDFQHYHKTFFADLSVCFGNRFICIIQSVSPP